MNRMFCGTCSKKFSILRTRKQCCECKGYYCKFCVMRKSNKHINCENCVVLTTRPLNRAQLLKLKARDLQLYLSNRQVSTRGCVEKEDLVNLLLAHVNTTADTPHQNHSENHNSTRQFFDNIRSLFTSTPDISGASQNSSQSNNSFSYAGAFQTSHSAQSSPSSATRTQHFYQTSCQQPPEVDLFTSNVQYSELNIGTSQPSNSEVFVDITQEVNLGNTSDEARNPETEDSSLNENLDRTEETTSENNLKPPINLSNFKSEKQLEELTVKQLKELLIRNRVDFKGCVEKAELLEKVSNLWSEHSHSREGLENLPTSELCKICMDAPVECVILECGHMATCILCGKQLAECPICRRYIIRVVRIFRS